MERTYELISVSESTGKITLLSTGRLTHKEACTMKSKFTQHKHRRIEVREHKTHVSEDG